MDFYVLSSWYYVFHICNFHNRQWILKVDLSLIIINFTIHFFLLSKLLITQCFVKYCSFVFGTWKYIYLCQNGFSVRSGLYLYMNIKEVFQVKENNIIYDHNGLLPSLNEHSKLLHIILRICDNGIPAMTY